MTASPARWLDSAWRVTALYTLLTIATTWPLAARMTSSLPSDLGDPLLNCFIIDWGVEHVRALASGDLDAFRSYWHAPMFHPEPLTLAYSEHLFALAFQAAPVVALTGNVLLAYNLLFLSTFVLSALGMYLLARELTGSGAAAIVAGLLYGFALYRVAQYPHLQALSSQWLPFVVLGLRRFFVTRRLRALAWAMLALAAQNLSNGYYLIYFAPFIAAYCLYEIVDRRLWTDGRVLVGVIGAGFVTVLVAAPFLIPYLLLRGLGFEARDITEVRAYSADLYAWVTAPPASRMWGWLQMIRKPENELFPGLVVIALAMIGCVARLRTLWGPPAPPTRRRRLALATIGIPGLATLVFSALVLTTGDEYWRIGGYRLTLREPRKAGMILSVLAAALIAISPRVRRLLRGVPGSALGFFILAAATSAMLTLGPVVEIGGRETRLPALYGVFYQHVPGFDGLRVPARYAMLTIFCLSLVAGFGARAALSRGRLGRAVLAGLTVVFALESTAAPITVDGTVAAPGYAKRAGPIRAASKAPEVYRFAGTLPAEAVIAEFPFGSPGWDLQAIFYQRVHRRPVVNGYSGGFPESFHLNREAFAALDVVPDVAWRRLLDSGATHVIVHLAAIHRRDRIALDRWLTGRGALVLQTFGHDRIYRLPSR